MKKRIFALAVAICLLLSLGACGEKEETKKREKAEIEAKRAARKAAKEASKNEYYYSSILKCCKGKAKTHKGYIWSYKRI